jgi:tetratricopeptide (TPR) repeat protein
VEIGAKDYDAALKALDRLLELQPSNINALRNRAIAHLQREDLASAEEDYDSLRRLAPRDMVYVAYYGLGEVAYRRKDTDTARKFYDLYLKYAPREESPELKEEKAKVSQRLTELAQARR